jgi:hypothetical protein
LNCIYHCFDKPGPGVEDWQLFSCASPAPNGKLTMLFCDSNRDDAQKETFQIQKTLSPEMQQTRLNETPELIVKPGLHEIKQCELYFKYHPVIPEKYHADLCPKPADDGINHVLHAKSDKGKEKSMGRRELMLKRKVSWPWPV